MPKLPRPLRVGLVGLAATALVGAGLTALVAPASAVGSGPATDLTITRVDLPFTPSNDESKDTTAAAGTCTPYEVAATTAQGAEANAATITVTIAEDPAGNSHDVDFCLVDGGTAFRNPPEYDTASNPSQPNGGTNEYNAGPSITTSASDSGAPPAASALADPNNPDGASGSDPALNNSSNPSGEDRASFSTVGGKIRFGVVGLLPNAAATVDAFVDADADLSRACDPILGCEDNVVALQQKRLTFTTGGASNTVSGRNAAADAVRFVTLTPKTTFAAVGGTHTYEALFFNQQQDVVGGVAFARITATSGPNADGSFSGSCTSNVIATNEGEPTTCTYTPQEAGTDTVAVFVNQTTNNPTVGLDPLEPRDTATANTTAAPVGASQGRFLTLEPQTASVPAGSSQQFVATVTGSTGAPANGVSVTFSEDGPGVLRGGTVSGTASSVTFTTGAASTTNSGGPSGPGRALAVLDTFAGQTGGTNTVVATVTNPSSTECQSTTSPAGRCTDSSPVTITAASPSPSATPTATISPTATPTSTASPTSTPGQCSTTPTVTLQPTTINATGSGGVTVSGPAGRQIELFAYSQPSTTYRVVRTGTLGSNGTISFTVRPPTNTRLYAQIVGCDTDDVRFSRVLNVRTTLSLFVVRNGKQDYTFSGDSLPARPGGLIVSLYRFTETGGRVLTAQARASSSTGDWSLRRVFTGTGRFDFQVRTGQDLQNAPGASNIRSLLIF